MKTVEETPGVLFGIDVNRSFELSTVDSYIGRSRENEIAIVGDLSMSRRHAVITYVNGKYYIRDLRSSNGTAINGKLVEGSVMLNPDDEVYVGRSMFVFCPSEEKLQSIGSKAQEAVTVNEGRWGRETLLDKILRKVAIFFHIDMANTIRKTGPIKPIKMPETMKKSRSQPSL